MAGSSVFELRLVVSDSQQFIDGCERLVMACHDRVEGFASNGLQKGEGKQLRSPAGIAVNASGMIVVWGLSCLAV